jgi:hypothetical protein
VEDGETAGAGGVEVCSQKAKACERSYGAEAEESVADAFIQFLAY